MEDEFSVFDGMESAPGKKIATVFQMIIIGILFTVCSFYSFMGSYGYYTLVTLPAVKDVYQGRMLNPLTFPFLMTATAGFITIIAGIIFIYKRWYKLSIAILIIGTIKTLFLFYID